jgi:hypothetical protein
MCTFVPGVCVPVKLPALSNIWNKRKSPVPTAREIFSSVEKFFSTDEKFNFKKVQETLPGFPAHTLPSRHPGL